MPADLAPKMRIPLAQAQDMAAEVVELFAPFCTRIEVLGSIRRKRADVGDIEIGLMGMLDTVSVGLFGDETVKVNRQLEEARRLVSCGILETRPNKNGVSTCGDGIQFLRYKGFALDVFGCLDREAWGVLKLIRTGSDDFNRRVVRQRVQGGTVLPMGMRFEGGRLLDLGVPVSTPEEEDVFQAIGLGWIAPEDRNG